FQYPGPFEPLFINPYRNPAKILCLRWPAAAEPSRMDEVMTRRRSPQRKRSAKARARRVRFLHNPRCSTCRKARNFMERRGFHLQFRDLWEEPLGAAELEKLIG